MGDAPKWIDGFNLNLICGEIQAAVLPETPASGISLSIDGVVFRPAEFNSWTAVVRSAMEFPDRLAEDDIAGIIERGTAAAVSGGRVTRDTLLKGIRREQVLHDRRPLERYVLVDGLSVAGLPRTVTVRVDGTSIVLSSLLPRSHSRARITLSQKLTSGLHAAPSSYCRVSVDARTPSEAHFLASRALDLMRATWNLGVNLGTGLSISFNHVRAVNRVRVGPVATLHRPGGALAHEVWWYDPFWHAESPYDVAEIWDSLVKYQRWALGRVRRYSKVMPFRDWLVSYSRALDERDHRSSFVALWSVFETLTGGLDSKLDKNAKRASMILKAQGACERRRQVLVHLQRLRNRLVHGDPVPPDIQVQLWQLRSVVDNLLHWLLSNAHSFNSHDDVIYYLDLPRDLREVRRRVSLMQLFLHHHTG